MWMLAATAAAQTPIPPDVTTEARGKWVLRWKSGDPSMMSLRDRVRPAELMGRVLVVNHMSRPLKTVTLYIIVARDAAALASSKGTATAMATVTFKPPLPPGAEAERPFTSDFLVAPTTDFSRMRTFSLRTFGHDPMSTGQERLQRIFGTRTAVPPTAPVDGGSP